MSHAGNLVLIALHWHTNKLPPPLWKIWHKEELHLQFCFVLFSYKIFLWTKSCICKTSNWNNLLPLGFFYWKWSYMSINSRIYDYHAMIACGYYEMVDCQSYIHGHIFHKALNAPWSVEVCINPSPVGKMADISQTIFSDEFLWMKSFVSWLKFQWNLFLRIEMTIAQHLLR